MGIGNSTAPSGGTKTFSDDVLKIEICGPSQQHLSVIDVPGIFKKTTAGMTTKSDIEVVRNMVITYMKNPRSVILAVIPANVDIANQEILEMADECDKQGERTLGVLTKPDLVDRGAENRIVDLIEGKINSIYTLILGTGCGVLTSAKAEATNSSWVGLLSVTQARWNWKTPKPIGTPWRKTFSRPNNPGRSSTRIVLAYSLYRGDLGRF